MSVHSIRLVDFENTSPPTQVLDMTCIGGVLFLDISQYDEDFGSSRTEVVGGGEPFSDEHKNSYANRASMAFYIEDFLNAIDLAIATDINAAERQKEENERD